MLAPCAVPSLPLISARTKEVVGQSLRDLTPERFVEQIALTPECVRGLRGPTRFRTYADLLRRFLTTVFDGHGITDSVERDQMVRFTLRLPACLAIPAWLCDMNTFAQQMLDFVQPEPSREP